MLDRLIGRITKHKSIIWGIRVPKSVKERWLSLSGLMQIPTNRLIMYILQDWIQQNSELLLDREARNELACRITDKYLRDELN